MNMEKLSQWPAIDGLDKRRFFNDIKGRREALASNVHRMFVDSEVIDVEACVANRNGRIALSLGGRESGS